MITCKSPVKILSAAHELGRQLFDERAHKFSRKDFTLPQLFSCLVLREHQKKSYRGVEALLEDCSDLRDAVGLSKAPDHNTLCRAFKHLVKSRSMNRALDLQVERARAAGLDVRGDAAKPSSMDSTCFESRHVSRHFERRQDQTAKAAAKANAEKKAANRAGRRPTSSGPRPSVACRSSRSPSPRRAT